MATARRALLVIDVQESFRKREGWPGWNTISRPEIAETVDRMVRAARERGELVVWVLHEEPGSGGPFDPANDLIRPIPPLAPAEGEPVLRKTSHNAFTTTDLARTLTLHGITELTVCGIRTEQCCETTARIAGDLGYRVDYAVDATATNPIAAPGADLTRPEEEILADPETLGVRDIEERTVRALHGRFAEVITAEDYITGPDPA
ncbi:isochorismatase family protein [Nocardiopsis sp. CNT-189]|uniref:cysteine hydrolase family protein n=1 Tax=Nocardiopsis oceanisediminis TaxID=2816862 RepID=UPI003B382E89